MSALARLEREFQRYVYRRSGRFVREVVGSPRLRAGRRLAIYADAYRLRLVEVLGDHYPALQAMAGVRAFDRLARAYVEAHPSRLRNVRWYGADLPAFLRSTAPWKSRPALAEMARLEWAMTLVFDAADEPVAAAGAAAAVPPQLWGRMRLRPLKAARRIALAWNVAEIRKAVDRSARLPKPARLPAPRTWLVWRRGLTVYYRPMERDEAAAFEAIGRGVSFATLCRRLAATSGESRGPRRAAGFLRRWLDDGLIREVRGPRAA